MRDILKRISIGLSEDECIALFATQPVFKLIIRQKGSIIIIESH